MFGEHVLPLRIPSRLLHRHLFGALHIRRGHTTRRNCKNGNVTLRTLNSSLKVPFFVDINHDGVHEAVLAERRTHVQPRRILIRAAEPRGRCLALVCPTCDVCTNGPPAHESREEPLRPPGRLFGDTGWRRHERRDDIDALCDTGHADVTALSDEHVQPYRDGQRVRQRVAFFCAFAALGANGVPDIPLVEADGRPGLGWRDAVFDAGEVDQRGGDLDGSLCG